MSPSQTGDSEPGDPDRSDQGPQEARPEGNRADEGPVTSPLSDLLARRDEWGMPAETARQTPEPAEQSAPAGVTGVDEPVARILPPAAQTEYFDALWRELCRKHAEPPRCPLRSTEDQCDVPRCRRAFKCGALPHQARLLPFTLAVACIVALVIVTLELLWTIGVIGIAQASDHWRQFAVGLALGTPVITGLAMIAWKNRHDRQRKFHRACLEAADELGMHYGGDLLTSPSTFPLTHEGVPGRAVVAVWGTYRGMRMIVARYETRRFGMLVAVFPDPLELGDMYASSRGGMEAEYLAARFREHVIHVENVPRYCVVASSSEHAMPLRDDHLATRLNRQPWQLQVIGGRLFLWNGRWTRKRPDSMPAAAGRIIDFVDECHGIRSRLP